jgi:hypothetical protein
LSIEEKRDQDQARLQAQRNKAQQSALKASQTQDQTKQAKAQQATKKGTKVGKKTTPIDTGAEQDKSTLNPEITKKVSDIQINRINKQVESAKENKELATSVINELDNQISRLRESPGKYLIEDSETGEMRRVVGRDIMRLVDQKKELEASVQDVDAFLLQAPEVVKYYEKKKEYADTKKSGTKYTVTFLTTSGKKQTETFKTRKDAKEFADRLNKAAKEKAQTRATEKSFLGLTLQEAASVIRQKQKGRTTTKTVTEKISGSKNIEELIQTGQITPQQAVLLSKGEEIEIKVIETKTTPAKYQQAIDNQVTLLLAKGQEKLGNTPLTTTDYSRRGKPLTATELEDAKKRAEYMAYSTGAGIILGIGSALDTRTYIKLGKDAAKSAVNPSYLINGVAETAIALKTSYEADPIATSGLLLGSVIGQTIAVNVLGPSVSSLYQKGIKPAKTKIYNKISSATETFYQGLKTDTGTDLAQALKYPVFEELRQAKKFTPISENVLLTIQTDPLAAPSFFDKGAQMSLWDQFRQWKKFDFTYIPADPSKATTGVYNEYVEFLKIQRIYLSDAIQKGKTTGSYGEFLQARKFTVDPSVDKWLDSSFIYFLSKKSNLNKETLDSIQLAVENGWLYIPGKDKPNVSLKGLFEERDIPDYLVDSVYQQLKAYDKLFGVKDTPINWTDAEIKAALKAFREAIELEKTGAMAPQIEAQAIYQTLTKSGVSASKAGQVASEYAFGMVLISAMRTASETELKDYMNALQTVMSNIKDSSLSLSNDLVADLTAQFQREMQTNNIKALQSLQERAKNINKILNDTGEINIEDYNSLVKDIQALFDIQDFDVDQDIIQLIIPDLTIEPIEEPIETLPIKLSLEDKKRRRELNLSLYRGKKVLYDVSYSYRGGKTQRIGPFEARSLPDALGKAQRKRMSSKDLPSRIVVNMIGEKR